MLKISYCQPISNSARVSVLGLMGMGFLPTGVVRFFCPNIVQYWNKCLTKVYVIAFVNQASNWHQQSMESSLFKKLCFLVINIECFPSSASNCCRICGCKLHSGRSDVIYLYHIRTILSITLIFKGNVRYRTRMFTEHFLSLCSELYYLQRRYLIPLILIWW